MKTCYIPDGGGQKESTGYVLLQLTNSALVIGGSYNRLMSALRRDLKARFPITDNFNPPSDEAALTKQPINTYSLVLERNLAFPGEPCCRAASFIRVNRSFYKEGVGGDGEFKLIYWETSGNV